MDQVLKQKFWGIVTKHPLLEPIQILPPGLGKPFSLEDVFKDPNIQRYEIELGIGWGEVAIQRAKANPNTGYIGFEVKWDRIKSAIRTIEELGLKNIRICQMNLNWFYPDLFTSQSLDAIHVYFPDPWPKRKHRKHRLINPRFLTDTYNYLRPDGIFYFATDYSPYARRVLYLMRNLSFLSNQSWPSVYPYPHYKRSSSPVIGSRFEQMQMDEGYRPFYMEFQKPTHE